MTTEIDFTPYARAPKLESLSALALVRRLIRAAPKDLAPKVGRALREVREHAVALQHEIKLRGRTRTSLRPIDVGFDNGWTALRDSLERWSKVHMPGYEKERSRAAQLVTAYFADGVEFVKLDYESEWAFSEQLLERIDEEGAVKDIERLAGAAFLENVRHHHALLGEALDLSGKPKSEKPSATGVAERVTALARAIGDYTRRLAGEVDPEDASSVAAFRAAMKPLDDYRASFASTGTAPVEEEPATEPVPDLPPAAQS